MFSEMRRGLYNLRLNKTSHALLNKLARINETRQGKFHAYELEKYNTFAAQAKSFDIAHCGYLINGDILTARRTSRPAMLRIRGHEKEMRETNQLISNAHISGRKRKLTPSRLFKFHKNAVFAGPAKNNARRKAGEKMLVSFVTSKPYITNVLRSQKTYAISLSFFLNYKSRRRMF